MGWQSSIATVFQAGNRIVLNSKGLFVYNGPPALGNLVISLTPAGGTDPSGNPYPQNITVFAPAGIPHGYININSTGGQGGNTAILFNPGFTSHIALQPQIYGASNHSGLVNEQEALVITSGVAGAGNQDAMVQLISESNDATIPAFHNFMIGGNVVSQLFGTQWNIGVPISATAGTSATPTVITTDGWHRVSAFANGWVASGGIAGVIYRLTNGGMVEGFMDIQNPVAVGGTSTVFTFGSPYIPTKNFTLQDGWFNAAAVPPIFIDHTTGNFDIVNYSVANTELFGYFKFPLGTLP